MAHTAMSGTGTTVGDDPLQTAVWRLRSRGCWTDAAALLAPHTADTSNSAGPSNSVGTSSTAITSSTTRTAATTPALALQRAALLVERCLFTGDGWPDAEDALRAAEAAAREDHERGAAACERGHLAYASTVLGVRDRADEARAALGRAAALLDPTAPGRALLDFRRGLIAEHLSDSPQSARAAYRRAHAAATAGGETLLLSFTWRHLAGLALREGELAEARHGFAESLRIREELGYLVGTAPALAALADAEPEPEAGRLRAEAGRLFRLLGGVPTWLADQLTPPAPVT